MIICLPILFSAAYNILYANCQSVNTMPMLEPCLNWAHIRLVYEFVIHSFQFIQVLIAVCVCWCVCVCVASLVIIICKNSYTFVVVFFRNSILHWKFFIKWTFFEGLVLARMIGREKHPKYTYDLHYFIRFLWISIVSSTFNNYKVRSLLSPSKVRLSATCVKCVTFDCYNLCPKVGYMI